MEELTIYTVERKKTLQKDNMDRDWRKDKLPKHWLFYMNNQFKDTPHYIVNEPKMTSQLTPNYNPIVFHNTLHIEFEVYRCNNSIFDLTAVGKFLDRPVFERMSVNRIIKYSDNQELEVLVNTIGLISMRILNNKTNEAQELAYWIAKILNSHIQCTRIIANNTYYKGPERCFHHNGEKYVHNKYNYSSPGQIPRVFSKY